MDTTLQMVVVGFGAFYLLVNFLMCSIAVVYQDDFPPFKAKQPTMLFLAFISSVFW
jgi:hypothetical protein